MKARLEAQTAEVVSLTTKINELQAQIVIEKQEKEKLQMFVKSGSLPDDTKMGAISAMPPPPPPPVAAGGKDIRLSCSFILHHQPS